MEKWILLGMAPVFITCIALEAWYWRSRRPQIYSWVNTFSNAGLALMHAGADAVATVEQKANELLAQVDAYRDLSSSLAVD